MKTKQFDLEKKAELNKARYVGQLSKEENEMLDIIADIIVGFVIRTVDERRLTAGMPQEESNRHCTDSK